MTLLKILFFGPIVLSAGIFFAIGFWTIIARIFDIEELKNGKE